MTWSTLKESILTNESQSESLEEKFQTDPDFSILFTKAMNNNAIATASMLVSKIDFSKTKKLLDLGGGSGIYSILIAKSNPHIEAIVYDFPSVCEVAQEFINKYKVNSQVCVMSGNLFKDELQNEMTDILIAQVLHSYSLEECKKILEIAYEVLTDNGRILIVDFFLNNDKISPLYSTLFSLNMLVGSKGGNSYYYREISKLLTDADFADINIIDLPGPSSLISAIKR